MHCASKRYFSCLSPTIRLGTMIAGQQQKAPAGCASSHRSLRKSLVGSTLTFNCRVLARAQPKACSRVLQSKRNVTAAEKRVCSASSTVGAPTVSSIDENSILDAVIVGAGISGLTTALVRHDMVPLSG